MIFLHSLKPYFPVSLMCKCMMVLSSISFCTVGEQNPSSQELDSLAQKAYIYGYPLVTMEISRAVFTNVATQNAEGKAPINQFGNLKVIPTAKFKSVVAPNVNTLYSSAWLDLSNEPVVLHLPKTNGLYYLMPILDAWTNVIASPGKRTTGTEAHDYAITGPHWNGSVPMGVSIINSPTNTAWILGRFQANGPSDYKTVNALQEQLTLTPLSQFGTSYKPPVISPTNPSIDMKTPPKDQVNSMTANTFFSILAKSMKLNPPAVADSAMVRTLQKLGITVGKDLDTSKIDLPIKSALENACKTAPALIKKSVSKEFKEINGWMQNLNLGAYGTDYLLRAVVADFGLGANLPQDAIYLQCNKDTLGNLLNGTNHYIIHFEKENIPPVNAFWSLTIYNTENFLIDNSINRYAISSWMPLQMNKNGSLDIFIQKDNPGNNKIQNWLPAPNSAFNLMLRIYWPKQEVLSGKWEPPPVRIYSTVSDSLQKTK